MILLLLSIPGSFAFTPVWVGSEFRESSFVTPEENDHLQTICGKANTSEHPWAVSILFHGNNRLGGSIISPYHILTVAHGFLKFSTGAGAECLASAYRPIEELQNKRIVVYGGKCIRGYSNVLPNHPNCSKPDVQYNKIRSVLIDGGFASGSCLYGHDFAIIELEHKSVRFVSEHRFRIVFNNKTAPICLPTAKWPAVQNILTVSGWGRIYHESTPMIHEAPMLIDKHCRRPWSDKLPRDAVDMLCATSLNVSDYKAPRICHVSRASLPLPDMQVLTYKNIRFNKKTPYRGKPMTDVQQFVLDIWDACNCKIVSQQLKYIALQGDSGSGSEQRDERGRATLIGLTSFGTQGCPANLLARFTRVGYFLHEICTYTGVCSSRE